MTLGWVFAAVLFMVAALGGRPAWADNWGSPMSFTLKPNGEIFADGDIEADTPQKLEAFLDAHKLPPDVDISLTSRGGDLAAGIGMGEIIRAHRLHTWVASNTKIAGLYKPSPGCSQDPLAGLGLHFEPGKFQPFRLHPAPFRCLDFGTYPGYCISACTFAFLGGVDRRMWSGSIYAVHQAAMECRDPAEAKAPGTKPATGVERPTCPDAMKAFGSAQRIAGLLIAYVQKMGVDPGFLTAMSEADPSHVNPLSQAQMKKYRILYQPGGVQWALESSATGEFFLQETATTEWKTNYVRFLCRRNPTAQLLIDVVYDPAGPAGKADTSAIITAALRGLKFNYTSPDWQRTHNFVDLLPGLMLDPAELIRYPFLNANGKVELVALASPRIMEALRTSSWFSITTAVLGKDYVSFGSASPIDREKFDEFTASCH